MNDSDSPRPQAPTPSRVTRQRVTPPGPGHRHAPQWVLGRWPITAVCQNAKCEYELLADSHGGDWVAAAEARRIREAEGSKGAL